MEFTRIVLVEKRVFNTDVLKVGKKIRIKLYHPEDGEYYKIVDTTIYEVVENGVGVNYLDTTGLECDRFLRIEFLNVKYEILSIED